MNNLLKIFLTCSLISSTVFSVNNFSQPLPETELQVGQNVSEFTKREEPITLVGGTMVWGFSQGTPDGGELQRPCTLGFPVKNKEGRLGFLTSYACSDAGLFVQDAKNGLIKIGAVYPPNGFIGDLGLDYMFVSVYEDYWLDKTSQGMLYSIQCGGSNELLPILPSTAQTLTPNFKVCAFGGIHQEMACGKILEFDVTIQVPSSTNRGKKFINFAKVVKVKMNKDYDLGYLGAPVYIPLPVPNSNKFVASPVGQIVETFAQFNNEDNQDKKIWYYIPLDRILEYSGLKLESGDLSFLLLKSEKPNAENFNNVPLTDNLTMSFNASDVNLVKRQDPRLLLTSAGFQVVVSSHDHLAPSSIKCTLGFAIRKNARHRLQVIDHGFLTLGDCLYLWIRSNYYIFDYYPSQQNPEELEAVCVGTATRGNRKYEPNRGLDFALVKILPNDATNIYWDNDISTRIPTSAEGELVNVWDQETVPAVGARVCWWGGYSGHHCGEVVETDADFLKVNVWKWPVYTSSILPLLRVGAPVPPLLEWALFPIDDFQDLIKVRIDGTPLAMVDQVWNDRGAPVYLPFHNANGRIYRVRPVGILMNYTEEWVQNGNVCELVLFMYCVSIDRILTNHPELELIGTPPHQ